MLVSLGSSLVVIKNGKGNNRMHLDRLEGSINQKSVFHGILSFLLCDSEILEVENITPKM